MNIQASLFSSQAPHVCAKQPEPRQSRTHAEHLIRKPAAPFGQQDRRGKYWYERYHDDVQRMQPDAREALLTLILDTPYDRMDQVRLMLDKWHRAQGLERDNFSEAMGR
jgi:hypothetical protein